MESLLRNQGNENRAKTQTGWRASRGARPGTISSARRTGECGRGQARGADRARGPARDSNPLPGPAKPRRQALPKSADRTNDRRPEACPRVTRGPTWSTCKNQKLSLARAHTSPGCHSKPFHGAARCSSTQRQFRETPRTRKPYSCTSRADRRARSPAGPPPRAPGF